MGADHALPAPLATVPFICYMPSCAAANASAWLYQHDANVLPSLSAKSVKLRIAATHLCRQERLAAVHNALKLSRRSAFGLTALPSPAATAALPPALVLASRHDPFFSLSAASRDLAAQIAGLAGPGAAGAAPPPDHTLALVVHVIVQAGALLPGAGTMAALATLVVVVTLLAAPRIGGRVKAAGALLIGLPALIVLLIEMFGPGGRVEEGAGE